MTVKTFWTIFLKIFGLYLVWQTLIILPSFFSTLIFMSTSGDKTSLFTTFSAILFIVCFFIAILRYCIFKTDWVIEKLQLEKGLGEEKLEINIHRSSLLGIAIIVLGGLMLADGLPLLVYYSFQYVQHDNTYTKLVDNRSTPWLVTNFLKIVLGYFMVSDSRLIVNFIERKRKKATTEPLLAGEEKSASEFPRL